MTDRPHFTIELNVAGEFYATFDAGNGEQVWRTGDGYKHKGDAAYAVELIVEACAGRPAHVEWDGDTRRAVGVRWGSNPDGRLVEIRDNTGEPS